MPVRNLINDSAGDGAGDTVFRRHRKAHSLRAGAALYSGKHARRAHHVM